MKRTILQSCLFLAILSVSLQAKDLYTVDELLLKALENSPDLKVSKLQYEASKSRYDTAFSGYLPSVNLNAAVGHMAQDGTFGLNGVSDNVLTGQLSLKQIIYDFGKTGGNADRQKYTSDSFSMQNMQDLSNKKLDVKTAYYNVLKTKSLIKVQEENVKLNLAQLYRSKKYFEAGIRTKIDVSDAKVRVIQAKLDLKTAEYDLKLAYSFLDSIVGFSAIENDYNVYTPTLVLEKLSDSLTQYNLNLHDAIVFAYENRYDIKKNKTDIQASESDIRTIGSEYYPSLYFGANYIYQDAQSQDFQQFIPQTQWNAMLNLDWNLYQGGATSAKKEEKRINSSISNEKLLETKLIIKTKTTDAYINVNRSMDTVKLAQSLLVVSNEKFEQASKRYEHGLSDYIELQEARQGYINALATLVVDYYEYYISVATLDNAIGK